MAKKSTDQEELFNWLKQQPELTQKLKEMKSISEDSNGSLDNLYKAEKAVVKEVNEIGSLLLSGWAKNKETKMLASKPQQKGTRKHSKKNSSS